MRPPALLVLADGTELEGEAVGWWGGEPETGEIVFNTALSGYQEILSDPSYAGQVVCFTYPHIGNYGVSDDDSESRRPAAQGVVLRELTERPSSWRASGSLSDFLAERRLPGIAGVDTRRLTRHLRERGALPGAFGPLELGVERIRAAAASAAPTDGADLVGVVSTPEPYRLGDGPLRVVAYDFGIKQTMLRHLARLATVEVVPATTPAAEVLAGAPDAVLLSNGPGDPAALGWAVETVRSLLGEVPMLGICLGHQLLGAALGGRTFKLAFGHHGANHPVRHLATGRVEITSQNHNYAVADVPGAVVTHVNLNDGIVEGIACPGERAFGVQYHPEAGPGPHDAGHLFEGLARLARGEGL